MSSAILTAAPAASPYRIAEETYVLPQIVATPPMGYTYVNSLLIRGQEPIVVDTGAQGFRQSFLDQLWNLVEPGDVRWVFLSHDDVDHTGNLLELLEVCPNATLVTNWFSVERLSGTLRLPMQRLRWVNDGERFGAGDRTLLAVRPPVFDSPTTRGLFDPKTGVYWASDCFAAPVPAPAEDAADVPADAYREAFLAVHRLLSPWHRWLDETRYAQFINRIESLPVQAIASGHGPTVHGKMVPTAFNLLRQLPLLEPFPEPTQRDLEALLANAIAEAAA